MCYVFFLWLAHLSKFSACSSIILLLWNCVVSQPSYYVNMGLQRRLCCYWFSATVLLHMLAAWWKGTFLSCTMKGHTSHVLSFESVLFSYLAFLPCFLFCISLSLFPSFINFFSPYPLIALFFLYLKTLGSYILHGVSQLLALRS